MKALISIRVSDLTRQQIADLQKSTNMNQTELVSVAIDRIHRQTIKTEERMTRTQAEKYLNRVQKHGYVPYHHGLVVWEEGGRVTGYGINLDGDGHDGRLSGNPFTIWSAEQAEEMFPAK